jgi:hypothetical protein
MKEPITTVPVMDLTPQALDNLVEELREYHAIYSPLFQRREQREGAVTYLHGLLLELPRTSIEPMILALEGPNAKAVRTTQLFISEGAWDDAVLLHRHWQEVDTSLGEDDGVLTLDGSDFLKQGRESVGVKRQYCGEVGKRANCQAGVFLGSASRQGYTLLDRRLYLPQEWVEDEAYAERRRRCGVPADTPFKTKPTLGGEMIQAVHHAHTLRARWVTCDEAFGRETHLLDHIDGLGLWYLCGGAPRYPRLAATARHSRPSLVGPGTQTALSPCTGRGSYTRRGRTAGRLVAGGSLGAAHDQGREQGPHCGRYGGPARHRHAGGLAWTRGLAGPAPQPRDR